MRDKTPPQIRQELTAEIVTLGRRGDVTKHLSLFLTFVTKEKIHIGEYDSLQYLVIIYGSFIALFALGYI